MTDLDDAQNELVETIRTLSELRHKKPAQVDFLTVFSLDLASGEKFHFCSIKKIQLKADWLQRENADLDKMLSEVKNYGAPAIFANNQGK